MAQRLAADISQMAAKAIEERGLFSLFLAGGSSPCLLHQKLASEPYLTAIEWSKVHLFWGDERIVPKEHNDSNYGQACLHLVDKVAIPAANVHPMVLSGESASEAAHRYDNLLGEHLARYGVFDLVCLGVGSDGHTASLFPGSKALSVKDKLVAVGQAPENASTRERVTLTYRALERAESIYFIIAGKGKAEVICAIQSRGDEAPYPSAKVRARHRVVFHIDGEILGAR